jgi:hypothetical protein
LQLPFINKTRDDSFDKDSKVMMGVNSKASNKSILNKNFMNKTNQCTHYQKKDIILKKPSPYQSSVDFESVDLSSD